MGQQSRQSHESSRDFSGYETQTIKVVSAAVKRGGDTPVLEIAFEGIDSLRGLLHNFHLMGETIQTFDPNFQLPNRSTPIDIQEVQTIQLNKATKLLRKIQKNATMSRASRYEELKAKYEAKTNPFTQQESQKRAKIVSRTIQGEACKGLYGKLRQIFKPSDYSSLSQIQVPRPSSQVHPTGGTWASSQRTKKGGFRTTGMGHHYHHKRGYRSSSLDL